MMDEALQQGSVTLERTLFSFFRMLEPNIIVIHVDYWKADPLCILFSPVKADLFTLLV